MKTILLKGEMRSEVGSRTAKELRKEGKVPCVMYSDGKPGVHFAIYQADFKNLVYTHNVYKVKLDLDVFKRIQINLEPGGSASYSHSKDTSAHSWRLIPESVLV